MNTSMIFSALLIGITVYMLWRVIVLSGRGRLNKKMLGILGKIDDKEVFFTEADAFINENKDPEYGQKVRVLRIWGDVFYERDEEFKEHLEDLNIDALLSAGKKNQGFSNNEDSFFYLYAAIPNRLYYRGRRDLRTILDEKLSAYEEVNGDTLLKKLYDENRKFYDRTDDQGREFIRSLLAGDYSGYRYSKQLIGLYKNCEEGILAAQYKEEGNTEKYDECIADLKNFAENTRLGARWLTELGIEYPKEEEAEEEESAQEEEGAEEAPAAEAETPEEAPADSTEAETEKEEAE